MNVVDLEIGLYHPAGSGHVVELRYSQSDSDTDVRIRRSADLIFNNANLRELQLDHKQYGKELTANLFDNEDVAARFIEARTIARREKVPMRVRLIIGPNAQELQFYRWETLLDPDDSTPLGTNERILLSRYMMTFADQPVGPRPKADLRALVVVANPKDLDKKTGGSLAPIDVKQEEQRARTNLSPISTSILSSNGEATLDNIINHLKQGYDILYLVCHGQFTDDQTWLYLEDPDGATDRIPGIRLVDALNATPVRPRLIVLASCESAGSGVEVTAGSGGALAPIGPTLAAEAGIGAVIAMQGSILVTTLTKFLQTFFFELQQTGVLDQAMATARRAIRDQPDWWMPVLYMRLKSGRVWYPQGFANLGEGEDEPWPALLSNIEDDHCTPILGPGLLDPVLGSRRQVAVLWAKQFNFPLAEQTVDDLPQVAQYLAVKRQPAAPQQELRKYLVAELREKYGSKLPDSSRNADLSKLLSHVGKLMRTENEFEPHRLLAKLPISVYVTTNLSNMLADAIAETDAIPETRGGDQVKRVPRVEWCRWNEHIKNIGRDPDGTLFREPLIERDPLYEPNPNNPLVYHLFGHFDEPNSIVLTEDDYFDYLIGSTSKKSLIPVTVRDTLANSGLLFLGYQLDDWNFRVLFRSIIKQEGSWLRQRYTQTAVQIDPEESRILEPEGARDYLEKYFQRPDTGSMKIFWGSSAQFVRKLFEHWEQYRNE